jgi:microcystin-dependent protein
LFAAIGTAYGVGNGTTTFNVPDLRGAFPVGKNAGTFPTLGGTGGEEAHTLVTAEMPAHQHGGNTGVASNAVDDASGAALALAGAGVQSSFNTSHHHAIGSEGGGGAHQNLPPYQVVNYIIKTGV